jgi:ribosome maturation factor RimP
MQPQVALRVQKATAPVIAALDYELVGVEYLVQHGRPTLRIYIDKPGGVNVDDCKRVSDQVSALLDVEDPVGFPYNLEVSSPGIERPLFEARHFVQFSGHRAKIRMKSLFQGRRKFVGVIEGVQGGEVLILEGDRKISLSLANIEKAHLVPEV